MSASGNNGGMKLQVMICTCGRDGLDRVGRMRLPSIDGVGYVVSCQSSEMPLPASLQRADVMVVFTPTTGLSNNRNHALSLVTAPYALIADDDLEFIDEGLSAVIRAFDENPQIDVATFRSEHPTARTYPAAQQDLWKRCRNYNVVSFEIALRTEAYRSGGLSFSPLMGIGAPYLSMGEENMMLLNCRRRGMAGMFFPVDIARHPGQTSGMRIASDPKKFRAVGAYAMLAYPATALLRFTLIAMRHKGNKLMHLWRLLQGAAYALWHRKELLVKKT